MFLYIDGVATNRAATVQNADPASSFGIAAPGNGETSAQETNGSFDEVAIYDKALSSARVKAHFDAGRGL